MAGSRERIGVTARLAAWLGGLLMGVVAGEDVRVRYVIAKAASRAWTKQLKLRAE
jgi:hypothetical protein